MTRGPHEVILASAGTGKTFRLARRYVRMLAEGADHGSILATTFTRKAAREILARIMSWLASGAAGGDDFQQLTRDVYGDEGAPEDWSPERCREILGALTRDLHRLQVRTLDSWFSSLVRLFGLELGLLPGWSLTDPRDDNALREEVLTALFEDTDREELLRLLAELQGGTHSRSVHSGQLQTIASGLELLRDSASEAWAAIQPGPLASDLELQQALETLEAAPVLEKKTGGADGRWLKGRAAAVALFASRDWAGFLGKGFGKAALEGNFSYYKADFPEALRAATAECARIAGAQVLADLYRKTQGAYSLLSRFDENYQSAKSRAGSYLFEDIPQLIVGASEADLHGPIAAFRAGGKLEHLMLDEFQDTSVWQWRVIEPLVRQVVDAEASSLFCVGDVKQSIYGWRQGERRLLEQISDRFELGEPELMSTSYRSSQRVLDAVNAVFRNLPGLAGRLPGLDLAAADAWHEQWEDHTSARSEMRGGAGVHIVEKPDDEPAWMEQEVAARVQGILSQAPGASIGVLVRTRKRIPILLHELEKLGVRASGEGGSELTDSQAVQMALSAFRLADSPHHSLAAYHLATGPFAQMLQLDPAIAGSDDFRDCAAVASATLRRKLQDTGVGGVLEAMRPGIRVSFGESDWEMQRFSQLVALGESFSTAAPRRPLDFVEFVEDKPLENPSPSGVRVMTVHASKGLEFDAVVLPLTRSGGRKDAMFLHSRPEPDQACVAVTRKPNQGLEQVDARLQTLTEETSAREQFESYCVLYVAMTRAKSRLEVLLEPPPKDSKTFNTAALVESALGVTEDTPWIAVDDFSQAEREPKPAAAAAPAPKPATPKLVASPTRRATPHWSPSGSGADPRLDGGALFHRGGRAARERGTIMHRLFEEIEWLEDFDVPDAALSALLVTEGVGDGGSHTAALNDFRQALHERAVKELLRRHSYRERGSLDVWRERPFLVHAPDPGTNEPAILRGTFDRVVVERDADGSAVQAHVIDFKTGAIEGPDDAEQKREAYRPQMHAYRTALCAMTGLAADEIRLSLLFVDAGQVLEI